MTTVAATTVPTPLAGTLVLEEAVPKALPLTSRILASTDGSRAAGAALRLAAALVERDQGVAAAVTVFEPLPTLFKGFVVGEGVKPEEPSAPTSHVIDKVRRQMRSVGATGWDVLVEYGPAASTIARVAKDAGSTMIVMGIGKHRPVARMFGADTAARLASHAEVPVLAVGARSSTIPRTAVAAIDFGAESIAAARAALKLLDRPATLHLVHVRPTLQFEEMAVQSWRREYEDAATRALEWVRDELRREFRDESGGTSDVRITANLLAGNVGEQLTTFARQIGADLITVGSHGHASVEQLIIGSVPRQLLRAAECSVLVVPRAAVRRAGGDAEQPFV